MIRFFILLRPLLLTGFTRVVIDVVGGFDVVDGHSLRERLITCLNVNCQASWNELICLVVSCDCVVQRALRIVRIIKILCGKLLRVLESFLVISVTLRSIIIQVLGSRNGVIGNKVTA